jgi:hypothetical protein
MNFRIFFPIRAIRVIRGSYFGFRFNTETQTVSAGCSRLPRFCNPPPMIPVFATAAPAAILALC